MHRDSQIEEKIYCYLHDLMSDQEKTSFEEEMEADKLLKSEVESLVEYKKHFSNRNVWEYKKSVQQLIKESHTEGKIIRLPSSLAYAIGVAASIILIAGLFYLYKNKTNYQELAMNAARNDFSQTRGLTDELDSLFEISAYHELIDKAQQELVIVNSLLEKEKLSIYLGRSYILLKKPEDAVKYIESLPNLTKHNCDIQLVLGIAYIAQNEKEKAMKVLRKINCYPQESYARDLLKKM